MPQVDLSRLIIRKKYLLPLKSSELEAAIFAELQAEAPEFHGLSGWFLSEKHKNCWVFTLNTLHQYVMMHSDVTTTGDKFAELVKEYGKDQFGKYFEALGRLRGAAPFNLSVYVANATESESTVDVEVRPALYKQIVQTHKEATEVDLQDSYFNCEGFVRRMFEGGLSGTLVSEAKMPISKTMTELLINETHLREITERLHEMLDEATGEVLISAWMGTEFISKFDELRKKGIRISVITGNSKAIRGDPMQKEKAKAFEELVQILGKRNISEKPDFHGRLVIVDNKAVVGSMDMDSYSLSGTRTEYAMYTEDPEIVRRLRKYFNSIFVPMRTDSEGENQK